MIFTVGVLASFALYMTIGVLVGRRVQSQSDYFVAGRNAPTLLVTGSLVASFLSTVAFMGEVGFAYDGYPMIMLILTPLNAAGYVLGVVFFGRYLRRSEALTVPEFFGKRFDSPGLQAVAGLTVIVGIGAYLIAVTQGASLIISNLLGIPFILALLVVWIGYTSFTFFSGSPGVLVTDTIMFLIFVVAGILGMSYLVGEAGGPSAAVSGLVGLESKPDILSWHGVTGSEAQFGSPVQALVYAVTLGIVWMTIVGISPWQSSRYLMAKNEHVSIRSGFIAMASVLVLYVFLMLGAAAINLFNPGIAPSDTAFIWAARNVLPTWLGVIIVTGIVAAALSSASTFLSLTGFSAAHDVAPRLLGRSHDPSTSVRFSRLVMLGIGAVVLVITYLSPPAVLTIGYFAATLFAASWGPVAILSIYSDRITRRGAIAGMVCGFVSVFVLQGLVEFVGLTLPTWSDPVILGFAAGFLGIVVGSSTEKAAEKGIQFRRALLSVPEESKEPRRVKATLNLLLLALPIFVVLGLLLFAFYYMPFSDAVASR